MDVTAQASELTLYAFLTAAVISDFHSGRVSNRLIAAGLFAAVLFRSFRGGVGQILQLFPNILIPVILLFLFYICGAIGAGDIKLFSMIGGFLELNRLLWCIGLSFLAGAIWSFGLLLAKKELLSSFLRVILYAKAVLQGEVRAYEPVNDGHKICFTAAILAGTILSYWCGR